MTGIASEPVGESTYARQLSDHVGRSAKPTLLTRWKRRLGIRSPDVLLQEGIDLLGAGFHTRAVVTLRFVVNRCPADVGARRWLVEALVRRGGEISNRHAIGHLKFLRTGALIDPSISEQLIKIHLDLGDKDGAAKEYQRFRCIRAIHREPTDPAPYDRLGILLYQDGEMAAAIACLQQAVHVAPGFHKARRNLAILRVREAVGKDNPNLKEDLLRAAMEEIRDAVLLERTKENILCYAQILILMGRHRDAQPMIDELERNGAGDKEVSKVKQRLRELAETASDAAEDHINPATARAPHGSLP